MLLSIWLCFVISTTSALCWIVQVEETYSTGKNYIPTSFCFVVFLFFVELVGNDDSWYAWISLVQANVKLKRERERERDVLFCWDGFETKDTSKDLPLFSTWLATLSKKLLECLPSFFSFHFSFHSFLLIISLYLFLSFCHQLSLLFFIYIYFFFMWDPHSGNPLFLAI